MSRYECPLKNKLEAFEATEKKNQYRLIRQNSKDPDYMKKAFHDRNALKMFGTDATLQEEHEENRQQSFIPQR